MILAEDLKKSILQYALEGKLSKQLDTDSSVVELFEKIKADKNALLAIKKAKDTTKYTTITEEDIEFNIPSSWKWIKVGDIGVFKKGPFGSALTKSMFVPKSDESIKVYEQKNAIYKNADLGDYYITKDYYEKSMKGFTVEAGDILVSCAGTIGETYVLPNDIEVGIINQALMRMTISEHINVDYFMYFFDHILKKNAQRKANGGAIKNIPPFEVFKNMLMPLPPIEEQQRIVDKLDEILPLIDEYSEMEQKLQDIQSAFPEDMKKAILQYAMQGKLTEQLEADSSVDGFLQLCHENMAIAIRAKKAKNLKLDSIDDTPFDIPDNWRWERLGNIANLKLGKTPPRADGRYWGNDYSWVSIADMVGDGIINKTKEGISNYAMTNSFNDFISPIGTLIMSFKLTIGKVSILGIDAVHNEAIISIFPYNDVDNIFRDYLFKVLPFLSKYGDTKSAIKGATLNSTSLNNLLIPLPPIEEQQRIVKKLDLLLPLVDVLGQY